MEWIKAIILGIVQGLTEFLPVSSSGHLVIFQKLLDFEHGGLLFEVAVHFGTLLAVVIVFREDIYKMIKAVLYLPHAFSPVKRDESPWVKYIIFDIYIIVASIPAAVVGLAFEDQIEALFDNTYSTLIALFVTGLILLSFRLKKKIKQKNSKLTMSKSLLIGLAQAFAIIPGISRSGSTIMTGIWTGINRETAAKFSFIMSVPVIFGATLLKTFDLFENPIQTSELLLILVSTIASAISGYFAIIWLIAVIKKQKLDYFGYYCMAVSVIGLVLVSVMG